MFSWIYSDLLVAVTSDGSIDYDPKCSAGLLRGKNRKKMEGSG
jgi:hypothetical protein